MYGMWWAGCGMGEPAPECVCVCVWQGKQTEGGAAAGRHLTLRSSHHTLTPQRRCRKSRRRDHHPAAPAEVLTSAPASRAGRGWPGLGRAYHSGLGLAQGWDGSAIVVQGWDGLATRAGTALLQWSGAGRG